MSVKSQDGTEKNKHNCSVTLYYSEGEWHIHRRFHRKKKTPVTAWVIWHRSSLTSECCGSSEATPHIHGGDCVPNTVLVCCVVQALHGAEPRPAVVASDHVNSIVEGHRGDIAPFPCNVLFKTYMSVLARSTEVEKITTVPFNYKILTGRKLHSCVFGSYFSTMSIGDCWLPNPPITNRTSLAPEKRHKSILPPV